MNVVGRSERREICGEWERLSKLGREDNLSRGTLERSVFEFEKWRKNKTWICRQKGRTKVK